LLPALASRARGGFFALPVLARRAVLALAMVVTS
jgi:hypothetical protein